MIEDLCADQDIADQIRSEQRSNEQRAEQAVDGEFREMQEWVARQNKQIEADRADRAAQERELIEYERQMRESRQREREAARAEARMRLQAGLEAGTAEIKDRPVHRVPPPFVPPSRKSRVAAPPGEGAADTGKSSVEQERSFR